MSAAQKPERRTRPRATAAFVRGRLPGTVIRAAPLETPGQISRRRRYEEVAPDHRKPPPAVVADVAKAALTLVWVVRADLSSGFSPQIGGKPDAFYASERFMVALTTAEEQGRPTWSGKAPRFRCNENWAEFNERYFPVEEEPDGYAIETFGWLRDVPTLLEEIHDVGLRLRSRIDDDYPTYCDGELLDALQDAAVRLIVIVEGAPTPNALCSVSQPESQQPATSQPTVADTPRPRQRQRRGRKTTAPTAVEARVLAMWNTGEYASYKDVAGIVALRSSEVGKIVDKYRKRDERREDASRAPVKLSRICPADSVSRSKPENQGQREAHRRTNPDE